MLRSYWRVIALTATVAGPTAQAADATLMLACQGTRTYREEGGLNPLESTKPISMGIIIDLTARTVTGLGHDPQPTITSINETAIRFGSFLSNEDGVSTVYGTLDRLTGDMAATSTFSRTTGNSRWSYSLKCRPTQRMF
jgi:hypothetical protein